MTEIETPSINKVEEMLNEIDENEKHSQQIHELDEFDYIAYLDEMDNMNTWFSSEKYEYKTSIQKSAASYNIVLPDDIAEMIVLSAILLPGCYTLTGLTFFDRNEYDLYAEYAHTETGYITNKTENGLAYKRRLPNFNKRQIANTTASLWLDENGSICGFRCIWVQNIKGKLTVDQRFSVLDGCWSLNGEIVITFEYYNDLKNEFEGYIRDQCEVDGIWSNGDGMHGDFKWFVTNIDSFLFDANPNGNDSLLFNKTFDIHVNEYTVITVKFIEENKVLHIYEKDDSEVFGYGKWYINGRVLFKNVKYVYSDLLLSFTGYWNVKRINGRLCVHRDRVLGAAQPVHINEYNDTSFIQILVESNIVP